MGGVRSLLFTDIVGSTRLWTSHEEAMAASLARHDELIQGIVGDHGGSVFKHTGDGLAAAFDDPVSAIVAAAEVQRRAKSEPWVVPGGLALRAATHYGVVHERDGDLFGPSLSRVARLLALCPGGGVLVSESLAAVVGGYLQNGLELADLGRVQLRDFARSELVYCLVGDGISALSASELSAARSPSPPGLLPSFDDEFVGREQELTRIANALLSGPLVSVVATGGMGKTRIAAEAARQATEHYADGVWWCDLTAATNPEAVPAVVLAGMAARQSQGRSALESMIDHLNGSKVLLVLDNCEHVIDATRQLATTLRANCPGVSLLCTSREALGLRGEKLVMLPPLAGEEARSLFISRAAAIRADLVLDDTNMATIDEMCSQLDGVPLALELAAARCRSMSPAEIQRRLDDRFRLLRGSGTNSERHRSLEAAVGWSYSLLDPAERRVFDTMSVFVGGATLDGVAAVAGLDEYEAVDVLDRLVARSMAVVTDTPLGTRYRQLETLRRFGIERLEEAGATKAARDAHLGWAVALAARLRATVLTNDEAHALRRYVTEFDNLRVATAWAMTAGHVEQAVQVLHGFLRWAMYRPSFEVLDWIDESTVTGEVGGHTLTTVRGMLAELAFLAGDTARAERLLSDLTPEATRDPAVAMARAALAIWVRGDVDEAEAVIASVAADSAVDVFFRRIYEIHAATFRWMVDPAAPHRIPPEQVVDGARALIAERRAVGSPVTLAHSLAVTGYLHMALSEFDHAINCAGEAADIAQDAGAWFAVDAAQICLASALGQIQVRRPDLRTAAAQRLHDVLVQSMARRNYFFVGALLAAAVPVTLWSVGDRQTALLIRCVGARLYPMWPGLLPRRGVAEMDADERARIEAEAARLDLLTAANTAIDALGHAVATSG